MLADQKLAFEASVRRRKLDQMRDAAAHNPAEARLYDRKLGGSAHVVIEAQRRDGSVLDWLVADLSLGQAPDGTPELMLVMFCPVCVCTNGDLRSSMTIRQSNRMFSLDERRKGEIWVNPTDATDVYALAGTITTHERIQCGVCQSHFRIDDSILRRV
jgi:uncharacterized protein YbaR (Trm112 family)